MIQTPSIPAPGAWNDMAIQNQAMGQIGSLMQAIQQAKEQRAQDQLLQLLSSLGPNAQPADVQNLLNQPRERPGGLGALLDVFNPMTPDGGMTGLERNLRMNPVQDIYRRADPMYQMKMQDMQTDRNRENTVWDWKLQDRPGQVQSREQNYNAGVQSQEIQKEKFEQEKAERNDPITSPKAKELQRRIDQLQRQRDNAFLYSQDEEVARIDRKIAGYQEQLDQMSVRSQPANGPAAGAGNLTLPQSWGAWFPKLTREEQQSAWQAIQQGMSPAEIESKLKASGVIP